MKKKIGRILFWFKNDGDGLLLLTEKYFYLANLLTRLINEKYEGKAIKFINIDFANAESYKNPLIPKGYIHYYGSDGGYLQYYGIIDFEGFNKLNKQDQSLLIWKKAFEYLNISAQKINNKELLEACAFAFEKGLRIELNADHKAVEKKIVLYGEILDAAIWINFREEGMFSKFSLERKGTLIFEQAIDRTKNGVEFFLEIYKDIITKNDNVIIKGRYDVSYLPLTIQVTKELLR